MRNARIRYLLSFFGICLTGIFLSMGAILLLPRYPMLRWVPLASFAAMFAAVYWLMRHFRGHLAVPTTNQRLRAAKASRRMAWIYFGGLAIGLAAEWRELLNAPHGLGFLVPFIPILLGTHYWRQATLLERSAAQAPPADPSSSNP